MYTVAANLCNLHCSIQVELPSVSLGLVSHCRDLQSQTLTHVWLCMTMVMECRFGQKCDNRNYSAQSSSVHLDTWSIIDLTTLVATFLDSSKQLGPPCISLQRYIVSCPDPFPKSGKRVWCSERLFLSHGAGSNGVINVIIAFPMHCIHIRSRAQFLTSHRI